jgi:hypothetical protein
MLRLFSEKGWKQQKLSSTKASHPLELLKKEKNRVRVRVCLRHSSLSPSSFALDPFLYVRTPEKRKK